MTSASSTTTAGAITNTGDVPCPSWCAWQHPEVPCEGDHTASFIEWPGVTVTAGGYAALQEAVPLVVGAEPAWTENSGSDPIVVLRVDELNFAADLTIAEARRLAAELHRAADAAVRAARGCATGVE